jgi:hypothetical protein
MRSPWSTDPLPCYNEAMETEPTITAPSAPFDPDAFTLAYLMANEAECPACGYNVHALSSPRCPECARPLRVMVVTTQGGYSLAWVILTVAASLAAGVGLFVAVILVREGLPPVSDWRTLVLLYYLTNLPLPLLCLMFRRLFIRLRAFQWLVTLPFLAFSALMFALLLFFIFYH